MCGLGHAATHYRHTIKINRSCMNTYDHFWNYKPQPNGMHGSEQGYLQLATLAIIISRGLLFKNLVKK